MATYLETNAAVVTKVDCILGQEKMLRDMLHQRPGLASLNSVYHIYPKYSDTLTTHPTYTSNFNIYGQILMA